MPEASLSQSAIFSARPTLRIAGQDDERATAQLIAMKMDEAEGGLSALELRFDNWVATGNGRTEPAFGARSSLRLGADLAVYAGDERAPREIFRGKASALELRCEYGQKPELVVLAEDALTAARRARRSAVYTQQTPAQVVREVAGNLGLTARVTGLTAPQATWAQLNETDLGFLRRLLAHFDADLQVVGTDLQVSPRQDVSRGVIELHLNSQLARVRVTADLAHQVTAVTVAGWNANAGAAVQGVAAALAHPGPGAGHSGLDWAADVFGTRSEHIAQPAVLTQAEADAVAAAALDQRSRRFVRAEGTCEGNAQLRVGSQVRLVEVSPQFDNTYYVVAARHLFDLTQGYRVEFSAECAYLGNA